MPKKRQSKHRSRLKARLKARRRTSRGSEMAARLKEMALSEDYTLSERMKAIDLLGELEDDAFPYLAQVAEKGITFNERMNALDMLEKILRAA